MSFVYFIRCGVNGPIKVGKANNVAIRLRDLDCGPEALTLIGTIPGDQPLEKRIHRALLPYRQRLEWFRPTPEVLSFVERALLSPESLPALIREYVESNEAHRDKVSTDAAQAVAAAVWAIDRICNREGVRRVAAVAGVSDDQISKYRHSKSNMSVVTFLRLQSEWPEDFALTEVILGVPHLKPEEVRANRATLENAKDAIEAQLAKLRPAA